MNASQNRHLVMVGLLAPCLLLVLTATGRADPLDGQVLKFRQQPMDNLTLGAGIVVNPQTYFGHDEFSTLYSSQRNSAGDITAYQGFAMADDFADPFDQPVVHLRWWGSYLSNKGVLPLDKFLIAFEDDVPDPDGDTGSEFSHPGDPLVSQIVTRGPLAPGSGTFTETSISPGGDPLNEELFEYNAELHLDKRFFERPDTVYWLKIAALFDVPENYTGELPEWGWHNRDWSAANPLASTAPAVNPGEDIDGFILIGVSPPPDNLPMFQAVYHFQDDAVTSTVIVNIDPLKPLMPVDVIQDTFAPMMYVDFWDGPNQISEFSKDLAFELYTGVIPEPAGLGLMGMLLLALRKRRE